MLDDTAAIPLSALDGEATQAVIDRPVDPLTIRALVDNAAQPISPFWPLRSFIACNPLSGFESLSFDEAIQHGQAWFNAQGYPSRAVGQAALRENKIGQRPLRHTVETQVRSLSATLTVHGRTLKTVDITHAFLISAPINASTSNTPDINSVSKTQCLQETLAADLERLTIKWIAAFLDEGQAVWSMPNRELGFYRAWKSLVAFDDHLLRLLDDQVRQQLAKLPDKPERAIADNLQALSIPADQQEDYLARHLTALPGWTGFIKWRSSQKNHIWQARYPISLTDFLAVRLTIERCLVEAAACRAQADTTPITRLLTQPSKAASQPLVSADERTAFHRVIGRLAGLAESDLAMLSSTEQEQMEALLRAILAVEGRIWLEAWEETFRASLLHEIAGNVSTLAIDSERARPAAQLVFCIDVRSEPFRRQLESLGAYETLGFAGFFGIPVHYTPFGTADGVASCPVLLQPKHWVTEIPKADQQSQADRHLKGLSLTKSLKTLLVSLKQNLAAPFALVETAGGVFGLLMAARTLAPLALHRFQQAIKALIIPPVALQTTIALPASLNDVADVPEHSQACGHITGLSADEQVFYAEASLRMMGLVNNFGALVVLCGHGGMTVNNPYAAGLDCGACGGNHGGPNARIMASVYNDRRVRAVLRERGIDIPDDTVFLAAEHNTTTDEVAIYNSADAPVSHAEHLNRLKADLETVRQKTCAERCQKFGQFGLSDQDARAHAQHRALDWAQVRPEWGLARNGAFIVGPRTLTQSMNLDSRCFLHSYDWQVDPQGKALEIILTAPLVVAEWINTQYYFSTVDNVHYGSGSKITHNVTGKIGVMQGNASDLMTGLPQQSLTVREGELYHEPLRLMAVVYAPLSRVAEIIARNTILRHFFDNGWVALTVIDPSSGRMLRYRKGKVWEDFLDDKSGDTGEHPAKKSSLTSESHEDLQAMLGVQPSTTANHPTSVS
ncbi:MAG: DUF2309 domain-containing protein [Candidatus Competibacteraceae bacterium]|nr:DUF2309 domain-containing protein [Candidatus Competibacteraceae bacterium]